MSSILKLTSSYATSKRQAEINKKMKRLKARRTFHEIATRKQEAEQQQRGDENSNRTVRDSQLSNKSAHVLFRFMRRVVKVLTHKRNSPFVMNSRLL